MVACTRGSAALRRRAPQLGASLDERERIEPRIHRRLLRGLVRSWVQQHVLGPLDQMYERIDEDSEDDEPG